MKTYVNFSHVLLLFSLWLFVGCMPDEDEAITPDDGASVEGTYWLNDYDVRIFSNASTSDTTYSVVSKPKLTFEKAKGAGKMKTDLRGFIEETVNEFYRTTPYPLLLLAKNVDPDHMLLEKGAAGTFTIKEFPFDGEFSSGGSKTTYPCSFKASGTSRQDKITLHFVITLDNGIENYFEGTAEGKKWTEL